MHSFLLVLNSLIMMSLPLLLGWVIHRGRGASWRLFGIGAVTFIISQIGHIPFNFVLFSAAAEWLESLPEKSELVVTVVIAGLSAGIFEEGARYLSYKYWAQDARSWGRGLMLGAGHGGAESIILGIFAGINVIFFIGYQAGYFQSLVPPEQSSAVGSIVETLFSAPWYDTLLGATERIFALCLQLCLSLMVMQVFVRRAIIWLFMAIAWHALANTIALLSLSMMGPYVAEGLVALAGLVSLFIIFKLKGPEPEEPEIVPLPEVGPADPLPIEVTAKKLEDSRYFKS